MLTELAIKNAKPGSRERKLADGHGLYLSILPTGFKGWRWKYRFAGREKRLVIGPYPLISAKRARELRDEARRTLLQGADPGVARQVARQRAKAGDTFEAVARTWHAAKQRTLTPRYAGQVLTRLEANAFPQFGAMRLEEVTPPVVLAAIRRIEKRGARTMAQEVRGHISEVFVWAIAAGLAETDPAEIIRKALSPAPGGRRPAMLAIAEARQLIVEIDTLKLALPSTRLASRLLALTAVRPGVLRLAERREFHELDGAQPHWRIPAAKMKLSRERKTDAKFDFVVPLSSQAVATVRAAMSASRHPRWIFAGARRDRPISDSTLSQLYLDAGYRGRHVPHGWRATFSTIMNERAGVNGTAEDRAIVELMLAHIKGDVEAAYNRAAYMPRRRQLAQAWADMLMDGMPPPDTLVPKKPG